eukprot:jgi/Tetstr1/436239/TSEL_025083.t1
MEALITRVGSSLLTSLLRPALVAASARLAGPALRSAASLRSHSTDGEMPTFDAAHTRRVNQMLAAKDTLIPEEAAAVLTSHWGAPVLPGQVLSDLTASQLAATLETAHPVGTGNINVDDGHLLRSALYMHAESVSTRFFGDKVFQRGVMIGLPGQTMSDLASDLCFFREIGADMIGMGPYIPEPNTWVADDFHRRHPDLPALQPYLEEMMELTTTMNALARITMGNINIAATTALQAINPLGRELALARGANVVMPIMTPTEERANYQLYPGKPCVSHTADGCASCLKMRIASVGKTLQTDGAWADPPHYRNPVAHSFAAAPLAGRTPATGGEQRRSAHRAAAASALPEAGPPPAGPSKGSDVPRTNIGVFGCMNAGKSTLVNALTRQETSIVDSTPGTTADTKIALMELHEIGPVKIFDTAGINEAGELGSKKARKTLAALKETDVSVVVVDAAAVAAAGEGSLAWESDLVAMARKYGSMPLLVVNARGGRGSEALAAAAKAAVSPTEDIIALQADLATEAGCSAITGFLQEEILKAKRGAAGVPSLPPQFLSDRAMVFLNIPMDAETPSMRLLRPQARPRPTGAGPPTPYPSMPCLGRGSCGAGRVASRPAALVQEEAIRHFATTVAYRMNLNMARSADPAEVAAERRRFMRALRPVLEHDGPKIIVTDSQAVDILHPWTLSPDGAPLVPFTTFSIAMVNRMSGGQLQTFVDGVAALETLKEGDAVLVAEACNHNRITDQCNDIGMVQIPQALARLTGGRGPVVEHAFGREYPEVQEGAGAGLGRFKLAIHCGACMIDRQKMRARLMDMKEAGVPVINYGLFLSYMQSKQALARAIEPWNL